MPVWIMSILAASLTSIGKTLFTEEVIKRIFIDFGWYLADKSSNDLGHNIVNTAAKALNYKYRPELDQPK